MVREVGVADPKSSPCTERWLGKHRRQVHKIEDPLEKAGSEHYLLKKTGLQEGLGAALVPLILLPARSKVQRYVSRLCFLLDTGIYLPVKGMC